MSKREETLARLARIAEGDACFRERQRAEMLKRIAALCRDHLPATKVRASTLAEEILKIAEGKP